MGVGWGWVFMGADGALPGYVLSCAGGSLEQAERLGRRKQVTKEYIFSH